jgi:hypothetical protein
MIIGADLLSELGIEINFSTQRIIWEGVEIPMKDKHIISDLQNATAIYYQSIEPTVLKEAEARQNRILDADYSALDLDDYAHMETHLRLILIEGQNKNKSDPERTLIKFCFCFFEFVILYPLSKRNITRHMFTYNNDEITMIHIFNKNSGLPSAASTTTHVFIILKYPNYHHLGTSSKFP